MHLKHQLFGFIFNLTSSNEISNNLVTFIVDNNNSFISNFKYVREEFEKRGDFEFFYFNKNDLSIKNLKKLSKSKHVFLNDNFLAMAFMDFHPETTITQLWHAPGAFKRFGGSVEGNELIEKSNEKVTYLINTSKNINDCYSEAFQINKSKIHSLGLPRMDFYFRDNSGLREKFNKRYPQVGDRKIVLYAPTFRDDEKYNNIFNFFDLEEFNRQLGNDYALLLRLHPKSKDSYSGDFIDVTDFEDEQALFELADILISDYSSVVVEFASLNKPIVLFAYDYDNYLSKDRGFYFDLEKNSPGRIVKSSDELISSIKNNDFNMDNSKFLESQFDNIDGKASKRIVDLLLK